MAGAREVWPSRLAANLGLLWAGAPLPQAIQSAGAAGFPAVELHYAGDWDPAIVREACRRAGVRLLGVNTRSAIASQPARKAEFRTAFAQLLSWCGESGAQAIHVLAGFSAPDERDAGLAVLSENVNWASAAAAECGIMILLEPLNRLDRPGYIYNTPDQVAVFLSELDRPNVRMQFDAYHVDREGIDAVLSLRRHIDLIGHVQVAASPDRREPDHGNLDYHRFFQALEQVGYAGWVGCEYTPRGTVEDGLGWRETLPEFGRTPNLNKIDE